MSERWNAIVPHKIAEMDAAIVQAQGMKRLLVRVTGCQCATLAQCGRRILNNRRNRDAAPGH
jgi:hypothetical protein